MSVAVQRLLALALLVPLGFLTLVGTAALLDQRVDENWLIPIAIAMILVGGGVIGWLLPGIAGRGASRLKAALIGAVFGLGAYVAVFAAFIFLMAG